MKIAYFDCFAGAGGDMIVAAMLDAGVEVDFLKARLATLNLDEVEIKVARTDRGGLSALSFVPAAGKQKRHRNLEQVIEIINRGQISQKARKTAVEIFNKLARAEAAVHNKDIQQIHFHEVGAVDAIVDIVSAAIGLEALGVEQVYCSAISVGGGTVECAHGLLPVPAPATVELLKAVPIAAGPQQVELLTPTAAAILTTIVDEFCPLPAMKIETTGYGAGRLQSEKFPNVLRLILGEAAAGDSANTDSVCLLETNMDDVTGELLGATTEKLLAEGALDVFTTAIFMKRNRPGVKLSVLCKINDTQRLENLLLCQGISLGVRRQTLQRTKLAREYVTVPTRFGRIRVKEGLMNGKVVSVKPEFSDCAESAQKNSVSVKSVSDAAMAAYSRQH